MSAAKSFCRAGRIGFCFGVRRTVRMAQEILARTGRLTSIGEIVHNPQVMEGLVRRGLRVVSSPEEVGAEDFLVRSHGLAPQVVEEIRRRGAVISDGVCPRVKKLQTLISVLDTSGFSVIIVGDRTHPEVKACMGFGRRVEVCPPGGAVSRLPASARAAIVGQTTLSFDEYLRSVRAIVDRLSAPCVRVFNTICRVTEERQAAARELSGRVQTVLVLGGRQSANTRKLYEICKAVNPRTFHVESLSDLAAFPLSGVRSIGLTSGTSTAEEFIRAVAEHLRKNGYEEVPGYAK